MPTILIVDKSGSIKELNIKSYSEEELYKKAGFKNSQGFKLATIWDISIRDKKYFISVYGKTNGRAGQENKYEFPPPIDNILFFGNCVLVNQLEGREVTTLSKVEWQEIYEKLYGGFEDIEEESQDEEDEEEEEIENKPVTKNGYIKDGFVVDDEDNDEDYEEDDEDDEEIIIPKQPISKKKPEKKEKVEKKPKKKITVFDKIEPMVESNEQNTFLDCSKELEEEEYL